MLDSVLARGIVFDCRPCSVPHGNADCNEVMHPAAGGSPSDWATALMRAAGGFDRGSRSRVVESAGECVDFVIPLARYRTLSMIEAVRG